MLLIKNVDAYAPQKQGVCDILLAGSQILHMAPDIQIPEEYCTKIDGSGLLAVPGFIDSHVHIIGGGGEGGFATRTPELMLSDAIAGGITTIVGCLGTDGHTRSMASLLAKAKGLEEEGLSTYVLSGSYAVPPRTLTSSLEEDILFIEKVIGAGEMAISDHRSSQPTFDAFKQLAAEARRGGMLSGKAGVVNLHLGDGDAGLAMLWKILDETEIPATQFIPTHINRNKALFNEGIEWAKAGGFVDFTASEDMLDVDNIEGDGELPCHLALKAMLDAGAKPDNITFTSDGQGSLPTFDANGNLTGLSVGRVTALFASFKNCIQKAGIPLELALGPITSNPARMLKLKTKGQLAPGFDADVVLLEAGSLKIHSVIAKGRMLMRAFEPLAKGTFE
jgi:beta-aspartyl-dipeptidase (metallo-type)